MEYSIMGFLQIRISQPYLNIKLPASLMMGALVKVFARVLISTLSRLESFSLDFSTNSEVYKN